VTPESQMALEGYAWPGNVRELKQVLERALVLAGPIGRIEPMHLQLPESAVASEPPPRDLPSTMMDTVPPMPFNASQTWPPAITPPGGIASPQGGLADLRAQRENWEKQQILQALEKTSGNQKEAAKLLGVSRRTLINKIEAYGIARPRKRTT
jgi:two-component system, NtrC family, response regulator AtoC